MHQARGTIQVANSVCRPTWQLHINGIEEWATSALLLRLPVAVSGTVCVIPAVHYNPLLAHCSQVNVHCDNRVHSLVMY